MSLPDFSISRAEAVDGTHVRVYFTCPLETSSYNTDPTKYTFTGAHALTAVSCAGGEDYVDVRVNEMMPSTDYTVHVTNVRDVFDRLLAAPKSYAFIGNGDSPVVVSATALDSRTVRVVFDDSMNIGPVLLDPSNYAFTGDYDLVFACDVVAQSITAVTSNTVDILTSRMVPKAGYFVHVTNVYDWLGNVIVPRLGKKNFPSTFRPMIESVACSLFAPYITVSFDRKMVDNVALLNPANYVFTGPSTFTGTRVDYLNWHTVGVYYSREEVFEGETYTLSVLNAVDEVGREVDPYPVGSTAEAVVYGSFVFGEVLSATALNHTTVQVSFSKAMLSDFASTSPASYTFSGMMPVTADSVSWLNSTTLNITVAGEMTDGASYTVTVGATVLDINHVALLSGHNTAAFAGIGAGPRLTSATALDINTIRLVFNEALINNAALVNTANYVFAGATALTAASVSRVNATIVDVDINEGMLNLGAYSVTVSNVQDMAGNVIDPAHNSATFTGVAYGPWLSSATAQDSDTIRLVFNESMANNAALINVANYVFSGPTTLTPTLVTRINATIVDVDTNEMRNGGSYTVTVSNVTDLVGNVIDPLHDQASFVGLGIAPQVSSAAFVDSTHFDITFDSSMEQTSMETNTNYSVSGPVAPTITAAVRQTATRVRLTSDAVLTPGDYTAHVINVTDLAGNLVDPAHDTATFTVVVVMNWTEIFPVTSPTPRIDGALVYDSNRNVSVLFGGYTNIFLRTDETWEYNGTTWTQKVLVTKPPALQYHSMAFDSSRNVTVLFGGFAGVNSDQTWEWNGTAWSQKFPGANPSARYGHAMAFDSSRNVTVLFGGVDSGGRDDETWEWNGTTWTQKFPAAKPSPRAYIRMAFDSIRNVVVLFGGNTASGRDSETWEYNGTIWAKVTTATTPVGRYHNGIAFDMNTEKIVMHGGDTTLAVESRKTWEYNGTNWTLKSLAANPSGRRSHMVAYDSTSEVTVLFGGYTEFSTYEDDTWEYGPA